MSKLVLNIYSNERDENGKKKIEKTYTEDSSEMFYGPVEDILGSVDLNNVSTDEELIKLLIVSISQVKPILKDVFFELTDEELKRTKTMEVVGVILLIFKDALLGILEDDTIKNLIGGQKK